MAVIDLLIETDAALILSKIFWRGASGEAAFRILIDW